MTQTAINWAAAAVLAVILGASFHLDGPSDWEDQRNQADNARAAETQARKTAKVAMAAYEVCGLNSAYTWSDDGKHLQCMTKRGYKTKQVAMQ